MAFQVKRCWFLCLYSIDVWHDCRVALNSYCRSAEGNVEAGKLADLYFRKNKF